MTTVSHTFRHVKIRSKEQQKIWGLNLVHGVRRRRPPCGRAAVCWIVVLCDFAFLFFFFVSFFFFTEAPTITDETDAVISSVYAKFHGEPVTASQGTKQYSVPTTAGVVGSSTRQCAIVSSCFSFPLHSFEIPPTIFPTIPVLYPPSVFATPL